MSRNKCGQCDWQIFSKGLCKFHWQIEYGKPIKKVSNRQESILKKYSVVRKSFLELNQLCQAKIKCSGTIATDVHHKKGKSNEADWVDTKYFLAVCRSCHQWIEENPLEAKQKGFSVNRL